MATKTAPGTEPLDVREIVSAVDSASHLLSHAAESLSAAAAIFQAIVVASSNGTLAHRLARLGEVTCEDRSSDFIEHRDAFYGLTERFTAEVDVCAEVRNG